MYLIDHVERHARLHPDRIALADSQGETTYAALLAQAQTIAADLRRQGVGAGEACPLPPATQDARFVAAVVAIDLVGAVPTLLTTGSTGRPKAIAVGRDAWAANTEALTCGHGYQPDLVMVATGPLAHLGCLSKVHPTLAAGATLCIMEGMKSPDAFFDALSYTPSSPSLSGLGYRHAAFVVPAGLQMLMRLAGERLAARTAQIDFIETGAAPFSQSDMARLADLLPLTRLYNTYASTEAGIVCTHQFAGPSMGRQCIAACVGRPVRHGRVTLADADGRPVALATADAPAYIVCHGPAVTGGTYTTSDLGYLDPEGRLIITGRADDIINVGGLKVAPAEVEEAALSMEGVSECLCIGVPHPISGQALCLLVVTAGSAPLDRRALARHLAARLERHKVPQLYRQVDAIRRTFNGKPDRKAYRSLTGPDVPQSPADAAQA